MKMLGLGQIKSRDNSMAFADVNQKPAQTPLIFDYDTEGVYDTIGLKDVKQLSPKPMLIYGKTSKE